MFTGIIQYVGEVRAAAPFEGGRRLTIDLGPLAEGLADGDSVAVAGACLTATGRDGALARFDVVGETLSRTTLGKLRSGSKVNLERALRLGATLDGHLVQGHVDGLAEVRTIRRGGQYIIELRADAALTAQMVPKGSVALDGVSLTLVDAGERDFSVALIPTTLAATTLAALAAGDRVNIETDLIGKYVIRYLRGLGTSGSGGGGITMDKLREAGFA